MIPFRKKSMLGTVAINLRPRRGSWGGANQWTSQVVRWLEFCGWTVRFDLRIRPDCVIMTHTGLASGTSFQAKDILSARDRFGWFPCVHRINDNDIRKETSEMDRFLAESDKVADHTVFVSSWLRDYHASRWFDSARAHSVILPGADPRYFHPIGNRSPAPGEPWRLVTHHWSNHWNKGFDIYEKIDRLIASGKDRAWELWVIGRWPEELQWQRARTFAPASGAQLANLLRQCHGYVSASRYEPGAMHVVEGLQCGLPLLAHPESGGTVEWTSKFGCLLGDDLGASLHAFAEGYPAFRSALLASPPSGSEMAAAYGRLVQALAVRAWEARQPIQ